MKTIFLLLAMVAPLMAQGNLKYTTPALIPAVDSELFQYSVTIHQISLTNETASDVTCTIKTKQSTPRIVYSGPVLANSLYVIAFPSGYQAPGLSWYCASGTAVSAQLAYRQ